MSRYVIYVLTAVLMVGCLTGCERGDAPSGQSAKTDAVSQQFTPEATADSEIQDFIQEEKAGSETRELAQAEQDESAAWESVQGDGAEYDFGPVFYELTRLPDMENKMYAAWDGRIYFRQYSDEDMEDGGLWAVFSPAANTEKALMCMEPDGSVIQTGVDYGFGALFIADGRLYSQRYMKEDDFYEVYSCKLDGSDVRTYDAWMVLAARAGKIICKSGDGLACIDTQTGKEQILVDTDAWYLDATEEEIFYYGYQGDNITKTSEPTLYSVDYEGGIRALKTVTNEEYTTCMEGLANEFYCDYPINIPYFRVMGDDLYFSAGAYNGTGHMYSGGPVYSMKKDGSDCKIEMLSYERFFYLYDDGDNRVIYMPCSGYSVGAYSLYGEASQNVRIPLRYVSYDEPYVDSTTDSVLFYPDSSGICYVLLTEQESEALSIDINVDGSLSQQITDIEYIDGRLFFTVTDLIYNRDESIGWRDYYDRGGSACYCKDLESGHISLLYEY